MFWLLENGKGYHGIHRELNRDNRRKGARKHRAFRRNAYSGEYAAEHFSRVDELFGNIANYAYNPEVGAATVRVEVTENPLAVVITFIDNGVPYDPLAKAYPDVTLSAEEREIGGLGIYMVKKTMDDVSYEYKDGKNILRIRKNI